MDSFNTARATASEEYTIERDQYPNWKNFIQYPGERLCTAENRSAYIRGFRSGIYFDAEGQTVTIYKAIVDSRSDTTPSDIYILEKPRPLRMTDRAKGATAGEHGRKHREAIPQCNPKTKKETLEYIPGRQ